MADLELVVEGPGGRVIDFPAETFVIGSDPSCLVRFSPMQMQAKHAEVVRDGTGRWRIRPVLASGAVKVNGEAVNEASLAPGDRISIGGVSLMVRAVDGASPLPRTVSGDSLKAVSEAAAGAPGLGDVAPMGELEVDTVIERRYRILGRIAVGGMGEVYRGVHVELQRPVALKVMLPDLSRDEEFVDRFKREAIASSRIGHQNIVDILDFGRTDDGRFYFVMEYLDGLTLTKHVRKEGAFAPARMVHVGLQAARALSAAHAQGIIHRDLKPENIMLVQKVGQPDFVKLLDFGIAKVQQGNKALTMAGTVMGTPQYMAPEQATGIGVDTRSDIYQLGLIFHELLRGKPTFSGKTGLELMAAQVESSPPPLGVAVPRPLEHLVFQMLSKKKESRPASMEAVVAVLETIASFPTPAAKTLPIEARAPAQTRLDPLMTPPDALRGQPADLAPTQLLEAQAPPPGGPGATAVLPAASPPPVPTPAGPGVAMPPGRPSAPTRLDKAAKPQALRDVAFKLPSPGVGDRDDEVSARRKVVVREKWPLVVALVALLLAAMAGTFALLSSRGGGAQTQPPPPIVVKEKAPPRPEAGPELVAVSFETEPAGAEVYDGDVLLGSTPVALKRERGLLATLRFQAPGYEPLVRKVRFEGETTMRFSLTKKKAARPKPDKPKDELKDLPF